jgi:hypothetical protein
MFGGEKSFFRDKPNQWSLLAIRQVPTIAVRIATFARIEASLGKTGRRK